MMAVQQSLSDIFDTGNLLVDEAGREIGKETLIRKVLAMCHLSVETIHILFRTVYFLTYLLPKKHLARRIILLYNLMGKKSFSHFSISMSI